MTNCLTEFTRSEKYIESVDALVDMFDREVFDSVVSLEDNGLELGSAVAYKLRKGLIVAKICDEKAVIPKDSIHSGSKVVIIGRYLKNGSDLRAVADVVTDNGATIIKMGFLVEDKEENARKRLFKGIPLESRTIL